MRASSISILLRMFVMAGVGCLHTHSGESSHAAAANVEIQRPENNGSVNILPSTIVFSDGQRRILSGGDHAVVSVRSGTLWVAAFSPDPYRPDSADSMAMAWRSSRFSFHIDPGETLRLSVEPKSKGSAYSGGWIIERAANKSLQATPTSAAVFRCAVTPAACAALAPAPLGNGVGTACLSSGRSAE